MSDAGRVGPASLAELAALIAEQPGFQDVVQALRSGNSGAIDGAWGSACALTVSALIRNASDRAPLVILPTVRDAEEFVEELSELVSRPVVLFPAWDGVPDEQDAGDTVGAVRLSVARKLTETDRVAPVVVTCLPALLQPVPSREAIRAATRTLKCGDTVQLDELAGWLVARGFERVTAVELPGEFSIRGGILDIFPASEPDAIRIELFGDEIESIRSFDVETQRRVEDLPGVSLTVTMTAPAPAAEQEPARGRNGNSRSHASSLKIRDAAARTDATESLVDCLPAATMVILQKATQNDLHDRLRQHCGSLNWSRISHWQVA
jgi:transcription-repair coupling factor (superfamily II helicase)